MDNPDLSMCFSACTTGKGKTKGAKKGSWNAKGGIRKRQSLADRIANSNCRLCGARGHWRQECPNKGSGQNTNECLLSEIHVSTLEGDFNGSTDQEVFNKLPISLESGLPSWWPMLDEKVTILDMGMEHSTKRTVSESNRKWKDCHVETSSSHPCGSEKRG